MSTILLYLSIVLSWPEAVRLRPKHVVKYNLIVIIASSLDVCGVLTVHNVLYKLEEMVYRETHLFSEAVRENVRLCLF